MRRLGRGCRKAAWSATTALAAMTAGLASPAAAQSEADTGQVRPAPSGPAADQASRDSASGQSTATAAPDASATDSEIVVTAQRRSERLDRVPMSISVLSGRELDASPDEGVSEALSRVSGVAVLEGYQGAGSSIIVRGVGSQGPVFVGGGAVAYYLDSSPFGFVKTSFAPDANAYDLERVEILRGPQGTLYGASALNGVVRVLSHEPDLDSFELKTRVSASYTEHGGAGFRGDAAINIPLINDRLAIRGVIGYQKLPGWIDTPFRDEANRSDIQNYRLRLKAKPSDNFTIGLSAWVYRSDQDGPPSGDLDRKRNSLLKEPLKIGFNNYALDLGYDLPGVAIRSTTSYLKYSNDGSLDINSLFNFSAGFLTSLDSKVWSQEVSVHSTGSGPLRWSAGAIYRDSKSKLAQGITTLAGGQRDTSKSYAVFGELTHAFADDRFEATAGLRYFHDKVGVDELEIGLSVPPLSSFRDKYDALTPRLVLAYHPQPNFTLYTSYSKGFRSGVLQDIGVAEQGFPAIDPDTLRNYEIGARGSLFGGVLSLDSAIYYMDWQKIQQQVSRPSPIFNGLPVTVLINGSSASGFGIDLGLTARPLHGVSVGVAGSWNNLEMDAPVLSQGLVLFAKGDRPTFSPEFTLAANADYEFPISSALNGRVGLSANHVTKIGFRSIINDQVSLVESDSLWTARASIALESRQGWTATLYADNLTNEDGATFRSPFGLGNPQWDTRLRPRTFGLQIEYRY